MVNSYEHVLNVDAVKKLQSRGLLSERTDDIARWTIKPFPFLTSFPYLKFCDDKIPWAYNMPIFLVYLGFKSPLAFMMCQKLAEITPPTRINLMECVKDHVNSKWLASTYKGAEINTLRGYGMMREMGLTDEFVWEGIGEFYIEFTRNSGVLQRFFDDNPDKNHEYLELLDLILELFHQRMLKLMDLNQAVVENLE